MKSILFRSVKKAHVIGIFILAFGFLAPPVLMPSDGNAQDARVAKSMAALKDQTAKLGAPKIDGNDAVGGRDAPALYFGSTKMNNNFSVVDAVAVEGGRGMATTLFVKSGDDYIRVATNVSARMGGGRGLGTILPARPSSRSKRAMHTTARRRFSGRPISAAMSRSKTNQVQSSVFILSAIRSSPFRLLGESTRREADSSRWVSSLERLLLAVMQISMSASDA
jgi:hypothetical protein